MATTQAAEAKDRAERLGKALATLKPDYMECRDYGHPWRPYSARFIPKLREYEQTLRCDRCGTERFRTLNAHGHIMGTSYAYAEGYLVAGLGVLSSTDRDYLRLANVQAMNATRGVTTLPKQPRRGRGVQKAAHSA